MLIRSNMTGLPVRPKFTPQPKINQQTAETASLEPRESFSPGTAEVGRAVSAPQIGEPQQVDVSHKREMRGAWVASVWNINFPSSSKLGAEAQKAEVVTLLDQLRECGFNSVFFQVRPEGDALYRSELEPWGSSLTGTQGKDPGYDPLQTFIDEAKKRNLEVHAWLNPYRAQSQSREMVAPHIGAQHPELVHQYGNVKWMDPGSEVVRERLVNVCKDLATRYDLDGIHFDDYFYPYPEKNDFPDDATWKAYKDGGGTLSRADWRRDNVNKAVKEVDQAIEDIHDHIRFGISPFGLPAPDRPKGITGFDQYEGLYADTQKWMDEGWVDYLAPQLYWPTNKKGQQYEVLAKWWNEHAKDHRAIFPGNNIQAIGSNKSWTIDEFRKEVEISRKHASSGGAGNLWWNVEPILKDKPGVREFFRDEVYREPALSPVMPEARDRVVQPPKVEVEGHTVKLSYQDEVPQRAYTVYRLGKEKWHLHSILPAGQEEITLADGVWAVAAASKHGVESKGVVVDLQP